MPVKILIVDDEKLLVKGLAKSLNNEGYLTEAVFDGEAAREMVRKNRFDLIILDVMLPGVDGLTLCREIRSQFEVPIIMLTARGDDIDKIIGLEMGADDYLAKPFNFRELLARIKAVLRRSTHEPGKGSGQLVRGGIIIDISKRKVSAGGREVDLTGREFELLLHLAGAPGRVFTREKLLEDIWGYDYIGEDRTVDVHIRRLREKIEPEPGKPQYIQTKWGVGYYFSEED
ncbi:response regulator transcription factor [Phosphitispora fastidiosa]|uniref:response regulator transcription factor n=1 Tax=Phosphitispora fastidiosa TaxID=2837202 RepID=UPI001E5A8570|nr:response regulator transcription factor [Phosphitispora fastidiosa]MBU7006154.1 DNA-binding response OmpR family regulator [Phosphitispora fastidiosa]